MQYANNKGTDQPAHPCSLISAFVVHCLNSIIPLLLIAKISRSYVVSSAEQAGLSVNWSQTLTTGWRSSYGVIRKTREAEDWTLEGKVGMLTDVVLSWRLGLMDKDGWVTGYFYFLSVFQVLCNDVCLGSDICLLWDLNLQLVTCNMTDRQKTNRQTDRQKTDRQRQIDRQTDRDRQWHWVTE